MSVEYVRLSRPEIYYGSKNFLESRLQMINLISRFQNYKRLRNEELVLKVALKTKVHETQKMLLVLEKSLPKVAQEHEEKHVEAQQAPKIEVHEKSELEKELDEIHQKLAQLG